MLATDGSSADMAFGRALASLAGMTAGGLGETMGPAVGDEQWHGELFVSSHIAVLACGARNACGGRSSVFVGGVGSGIVGSERANKCVCC